MNARGTQPARADATTAATSADAEWPLPAVEATPVAASVREQYAPYFQGPAVGSDFRNPWPHPKVPGLGAVLRWKTQAKAPRRRST